MPESFLIKLQAEACNFIEKETLEEVFSRKFCEISKNTFWKYTHIHAFTEKLIGQSKEIKQK